MKKASTIIVALAVLAAGTFKPGSAHAQNAQGQTVITGGAGFSLAGILFTLIKDALNSSNVTSKTTPVIGGMVDYGISDHFSLGGAYTYQSVSASYTSYTKDTITYTGNFKDKISRQNFGVRPLFHFGSNENFDTYAGARLSYTIWKYTSNARTDVSSTDFSGTSRIHFQALFGMRYFFTENIGFNFEAAVGPSYYAFFGINARFGSIGQNSPRK
ncbi:MAG TPA: outer membrane beta-barrel protein [Bacteroidia bacterium]|jgi:hypothetical protein